MFAVFSDLTEIDGLIMKEGQIVIPRRLRTDLVGISHQGVDKTLQFMVGKGVQGPPKDFRSPQIFRSPHLL